MPNLTSVLKHEIQRIARKELRAELASVKQASVQYRSDLAKLKRELRETEKAIARLQRDRTDPGRRDVAPAVATDGKRWSPRRIRAHRKSLGLSAATYGALIGVTGHTVYLWEQGKSRPRPAQFAAFLAVRALGKREVQARLRGATSAVTAERASTSAKKATAAPWSNDDAARQAKLEKLLTQLGGNISAVAREMGKARIQIHRWLRRYGMDLADYRGGLDGAGSTGPRRPRRKEAIAPAGAKQKAQLEKLLAAHEGNVVAVARSMDKYPTQIHRWLRRYGIDVAAYRAG